MREGHGRRDRKMSRKYYGAKLKET